ncbi:MAG: hypothetical protein ACREQL_06855 [Candidatus Binatia bacterium]
MMARRAAGIVQALVTLVAYLGVVVWLTWPLAAHLGTHLPNTHIGCEFDLLHFTAILAHGARALAAGGTTLLEAPFYYPAPHALLYGEYGLGAQLLFAPVFLFTGSPTVAVNVLFLGGVALTAWSLHLVARRWTGSAAAAAVAGATFLLTGWVLYEFLPTAPPYVPLFWLPPIILLASSAAPSSWRRLMVLGGLIVLQSLASPVYVAPAVFAVLGVLAAWRLCRPATRRAGLQLVGVLVGVLLVLAPAYAGYAWVRRTSPSLKDQSVWNFLVTPRFPEDVLGNDAPTAVPFVALAVGLAGAVLAARGARVVPARAWRHVALWAVVGTLISLPPEMRIGDEVYRLPHAWLGTFLPIFEVGGIRTPIRFGVVALMGLSLLAALGTAELGTRLGRRGVVALAVLTVGLMYGEYVVGIGGYTPRRARGGPYPLAAAVRGDTPLVAALAHGRGPVLELPIVVLYPFLYWPPPQARAMYRGIFHRRPILNGSNSYWPMSFAGEMEAARKLPDPFALGVLRRASGLTTVVVHGDELDAAQRSAWEQVAAEGHGPLRLIARDGADLVFDVSEAAPSS